MRMLTMAAVSVHYAGKGNKERENEGREVRGTTTRSQTDLLFPFPTLPEKAGQGSIQIHFPLLLTRSYLPYPRLLPSFGLALKRAQRPPFLPPFREEKGTWGE